MQFTDVVPCKNKGKWVNTCKYIILHHCGGGSYKSNLKILSGNTDRQVSCHFLIGPEWEIAKIGTPEEIQRHAGESRWGKLVWMNQAGIGIEIVDDPKWTGSTKRFTDKQRAKVRELVRHLAKAYNIPVENILKHADLTRAGSAKQQLRDGKSSTRKVDADRMLWVGEWYNTFDEYRRSFYPL